MLSRAPWNPIGQVAEIDARPGLDLDLVDRADVPVEVIEEARLLQVLEGHVDVSRVVLAHAALEVAHGGERRRTRLGLGLAEAGDQQHDRGARRGDEEVLVPLLMEGRERIAEDRARVGRLLIHLLLQLILEELVELVVRVGLEVLEHLGGRCLLLVRVGHVERRGERSALAVEQELGEVARPGPLLGGDADELDRLVPDLAVDAEVDDPGALHRRGHGQDVVAGGLLDPRHDLLPVVEPIEGQRLDVDVGEHAVEAVAHLVGEAGHHGVDHDHRGDAQHHADDARQRDVPRPEIPPAEQVFVHLVDSLRMGRTAILGGRIVGWEKPTGATTWDSVGLTHPTGPKDWAASGGRGSRRGWWSGRAGPCKAGRCRCPGRRPAACRA